MLKLGVIGYGKRANDIWSKSMMDLGLVTVAAIADPQIENIKVKYGENLPGCRYYTDAKEMLDSEKLDGVLVATRCNLHTQYAKLVAEYDLPLFLEKPVAVTKEELDELETIVPKMNEKTVVCFPLRLSQIVEAVKDIIDRGCIGEIAQVQAYNNVNYARGYYHGWYRDESITGGLFLQKSTHDLDYINYVIGQKAPKTICAMESKMVFKGDHPENLKCADCPERLECPESIYNISKYDAKYAKETNLCCFAKDTGNHDSATVMMQYENGLHVVYTQNFIARKSAGKRGARFIGYKGTVEFDFNTKSVRYVDHMSDRVDNIIVENSRSHSGGDIKIVNNFIDVMRGVDVSHSPLSEGILSARMCLAAKESAKTQKFVGLK